MATSRINHVSLAKAILLLFLAIVAFHSISVVDAAKDSDDKVSTGEKNDKKSDKAADVSKSADSNKNSNDKKADTQSDKKNGDKESEKSSSKDKKTDDGGNKSSKDKGGKTSESGNGGSTGENGSAPSGAPTTPASDAPSTPTNGSTGGSTGVKSGGSGKAFSVLDFGAKADGSTDNAASFVKAWRAACDSGAAAQMVIPKGDFLAGQMDFTGPCKGSVTVEVTGTLKAKPDPKAYSEDTWMKFESVSGVLITGAGTVDGQGPLTWKYNSGGGSLPASIKFIDSKEIEISQIRSLNAMGFHLSIVQCTNVKIANVKIEAPDESPNTDGIHISQTSNMDVVDSTIGTGDDCVGIIQGSTNINVNNVVCGPGHGLSIGSLGKRQDEKPVSGVSITNSVLKGTDNGLRIKTFAGSPPGSCTGVIFKDITMDNVKNPIIIDQLYGKESTAPSKVKISDVQIANVKGTSRSEVGVLLECSKEVPCEGIQMSNIDLKFNGGGAITSQCVNAKITYSGPQSPVACK